MRTTWSITFILQIAILAFAIATGAALWCIVFVAANAVFALVMAAVSDR